MCLYIYAYNHQHSWNKSKEKKLYWKKSTSWIEFMVFFIRLALSWTQISFNLYVMFIMCKCNYYFDSIIFGIDSLDFYFFYVFFFFFFGVAKWFQQKWGLGEKIVIVWVTFIWHSSDFRSYYIWHTFCIYSQERILHNGFKTLFWSCQCLFLR